MLSFLVLGAPLLTGLLPLPRQQSPPPGSLPGFLLLGLGVLGSSSPGPNLSQVRGREWLAELCSVLGPFCRRGNRGRERKDVLWSGFSLELGSWPGGQACMVLCPFRQVQGHGSVRSGGVRGRWGSRDVGDSDDPVFWASWSWGLSGRGWRAGGTLARWVRGGRATVGERSELHPRI